MELLITILVLAFSLHASEVASSVDESESLIGLSHKECLVKGFDLEKINWYRFRGVTVFGEETLQVYKCKSEKNDMVTQFFLFRNGKLVCIESRVNLFTLKKDDITNKFLKPILKHYGVKNSSKHFYRSSNIKVRGWLMSGKRTSTVFATGDFKDNPQLSWIKIRIFDRRFFNYRNQHKFWPNDYGSERLILR